MELTSVQKRQLRLALQATFLTWNALALDVEELLEVPLNTLASENNPFPETVFNLIKWAESRGRVRELLEMACRVNPGNPELADLMKVFNAQGGETVQPVKDLLDVLSRLLEDPKVREKVFAFRNYFQTIRTQIALLGDYKELHDTLHDIQMGLYEQIEGGISRFTGAADATRDELEDHRTTLNDAYIKRIRAVVERQSAAVEEANNVLDLLEKISEKLRIGIEQAAPLELKAALRRLTQVLSIRPPIIDTALYQASRTLPLRPIADSLKVVCQEFERLRLAPEKMSQFSQGIDALHQLDVSLKLKIDAHYKWQDLDIKLRRIESSLEHDVEELRDEWLGLKEQAERLAQTNADGWGAEFLTATAALETVVSLAVVANVQRPFRKWRRMASRRFYDVDKSLREQCGLLRTTCEPLDAVLGMI